MIRRRTLAPNNRQDMPLEELVGIQFAEWKFPKIANDETTVQTYDTSGRGVQGESVNSGQNRPIVIRKQFNTRG